MAAKFEQLLYAFGPPPPAKRVKALDQLASPEGALAEAPGGLPDLTSFEPRLNVLEDATGLAPLPSQPPDDAYNRALELRVRSIRSRLYRLGYLSKDNESEELDQDLEMAIAHFQIEATPITIDAWVGSETWGALQELVAFEPVTNINKWLRPGSTMEPCPALIRGAALRLQVFGFRDGPVTPEFQKIRIALHRFKRVAFSLALAATPPEHLTDIQAITVLFGHDKMAERITSPSSVARDLMPMKTEGRVSALRDDRKRFLVRFILIELWLLGYCVTKDLEEDDLASLRKPLATFWESVRPDLTHYEVTRRAQYLQTFLLDEMDKAKGSEGQFPLDQVQSFVDRNSDDIHKLWAHGISKPVFFIWDGIKRAFRWLASRLRELAGTIRDLLTRGVEYAKTFVWNIIKVLYRGATKVLTAVRKGIAAFVEGTGMYLRGEILLRSSSRIAGCGLSADGDAMLWLSTNVMPSAQGEILNRLSLTAKSLAFAAFVIPQIAGLLAGAFAGFLSWPVLLVRLLRVGPEITARFEALLAAEATLMPAAPTPVFVETGRVARNYLLAPPTRTLPLEDSPSEHLVVS